MRILIIEDEPKLSAYLQKIFESKQYTVSACSNAEDAEAEMVETLFDLLILDLMLPGVPGEEFLAKIRKSGFEGPVLVLTAKDMTSSKVELLELGADDYLVKPFSIEELLARMKALQRRYNDKQTQSKLEVSDLVFYRKQNKVLRGNKEIYLTKKEGNVLALLMSHSDKVIRTEDILVKVWKTRMGYHSNIVQATIRRLRKKIDEDFDHHFIRNVHGIGYKLESQKNKKS